MVPSTALKLDPVRIHIIPHTYITKYRHENILYPLKFFKNDENIYFFFESRHFGHKTDVELVKFA
jgi:hypothetical protein